MIIYVALCAIVAYKANKQCSLALWVGLISADIYSQLQLTEYHAHTMLFCAFLCILKFDGRKPEFLNAGENGINYAVSYLYIPRILSLVLPLVGVASLEQVWLISNSILMVQATLIAGSAVNGYRDRVGRGFFVGRRDFSILGFKVKRLFN